MPAFFIGLVVLLAVMMIGRWFASTPPKQILRGARWAGIGLLLAAVAGLAITGRLGWALAGLAGLVPWAMRLIHLHNLARVVRKNFGGRAGVRTPGGDGSQVETPFLKMTLDHDSGTLSGAILQGPSQGKALSQLSFDEALDLHRFCAADPQSVQLLEAWLERTWPDWRDHVRAQEQASGGARPAAGAMSRQEALDILGLPAAADREAIKRAHRDLMIRLHPDHGGSNYLAAKINQAKDLLLGD